MVLRESVGIWLGFHTAHFRIGRENPVIFRISHTVHLGFSALFIWAGPAIFFLLIQRVFKYSNDSNLQNKKLVLTELEKFQILAS
jgi:hypothetical protein